MQDQDTAFDHKLLIPDLWQQEALRYLREGLDVVLHAPTGAGKTFVFEMLMEDLSSLGTGHAHHYELRAVRVEDGKASLQEAAQPSDFIVRAEAF